ncbi:MAG: hypothetical protein DSY37_03470 [Hyperthermus sp.]|nr:MAG: hypothetical protein DSY37_03470 [Hyperthermus sp.]
MNNKPEPTRRLKTIIALATIGNIAYAFAHKTPAPQLVRLAYYMGVGYATGSPTILAIALAEEIHKTTLAYLARTGPLGLATPLALAAATFILSLQTIRGRNKDPLLQLLQKPPKPPSPCHNTHTAPTTLLLAAILAYTLTPTTPIPIYIHLYHTATAILAATLYSTLKQPVLQTAIALNIALTHLNPLAPLLLTVLHPPATARIHEEEQDNNKLCIGTITATYTQHPLKPYRLAINTTRQWGWQATGYNNIPYCIKLSTTTSNHILIAGMSGSGKSTLAATIARKLSGKIPVIILDPHGEYGSLIDNADRMEAHKESVNPFELGNTPPTVRATEITQLITSIYRLGPLQQKVLEEAILLAYETQGAKPEDPATWNNTPTFETLIEVLNTLAEKEAQAATLIPYIKSLATKIFHKTSKNITTLVDKNKITIIDLSKLPTPQHKQVYTETLLKILDTRIREKGTTNKPRLAIIIDEAHLVASRKHQAHQQLPRMYKELRKYGAIMIAITQRITEINEDIIANTGHHIILKHTEPKEVHYLAKLASGYNEEDRIKALEETITTLEKGKAIIRSTHEQEPVILAYNTIKQPETPREANKN